VAAFRGARPIFKLLVIVRQATFDSFELIDVLLGVNDIGFIVISAGIDRHIFSGQENERFMASSPMVGSSLSAPIANASAQFVADCG